MIFYIASSYPRKAEAADLREKLQFWGQIVQARWIDTEPTMNQAEWAVKDVEDVTEADAVICLTGDTLSRGGRHSEVGIALGQGKPVILVGPREQVFHHHPNVRCVQTIDELQDLISAWVISLMRRTPKAPSS